MIMSANLSQLAREWIGKKITGDSSAITLTDLKVKYYLEYLQVSRNGLSVTELEKRWIRKWIADNGATPVNTQYLSSLWRQAVATLGKPVASNRTQNEQTFYLNAS